MNSNIYVGKDQSGQDVKLDLSKLNLNLILLSGTTGSGKSVFHFNVYKELVKQNSPEALRFVFIDNTRVDFHYFPENSQYHRITDHLLGISALLDILELVKARSLGQQKKDPMIVVHIEECDGWAADYQKMETFFKEFNKYKQGSNVFVIYSTSRPSVEVLPDWLIESADLKVVFNLASETDCKRLIVNTAHLNFMPGERLLVLKNDIYHCIPFSDEEYKEINAFEYQKELT